MILTSLIRKRDVKKSATAIPATQKVEGTGTVARIAAVAVANSKGAQAASPPKVGAGNTANTSRRWLLYYPDREPVDVACSPGATHDEILKRHADAIGAEPFTPAIRQPSAPMTDDDERAIRAWLELIEERDPVIIAEVLNQCQNDADARDHFSGAAADILRTGHGDAGSDDDRRTCTQCANLVARHCLAAQRSAARSWRAGTMSRFATCSCAAKATHRARTTQIGDMAANAGRD